MKKRSLILIGILIALVVFLAACGGTEEPPDRRLIYGPAGRDTGIDAMAKPSTLKIRMNSSADTGFFYVTKKNPKTKTEKLTLRKYDPVARRHVEFKEGKIK